MKRSLADACLRGRLFNPRISFLACGLLLSVMVIGCAGSLDPGVGGGGSSGGMGGSSGNGCQVAIFMNQCAVCHASVTAGSAGLDLASPNPETRLVGKMTGTMNAASCMGMTLINPNTNPATGVFVDKITMSTPPCGSSMPLGSLPSAADQACLTSWATMVANAPAPFSGEDTP